MKNILNDFIRQHSQELYKERKHLDSSMEFGKQTFDLYASLKKVDIVDAHIDTNGHFRAYIIDTYDFNKGESPIVEWARNLQELGYLAPYYTIIILNVIPKYNYEPVIH